MKSTAMALAFSVLLALPLTGCSDEKSAAPKPASEGTATSVAADATSPQDTAATGDANKNPSIIFCEKSGGQYKLVKTADGEKGECHLSNGQVEDADALYMGHMKARGTMGMGQPTPQAPEYQNGGNIPKEDMGMGMGNLAAQYCGQIGGTMKVVVESGGEEVGYCRLKDGREVKAWELFRAHHPQQ